MTVTCVCEERKKSVYVREWIVLDRKCNFSAFNGYRYASSDYSKIHCRKCLSVWRTKAKYVDLLKDGIIS